MGGPKKYNIIFNYEEIKNSKSNIILLGEVGSGKTTIMNKLTDAKFKTGKDCPSVTNEVQICGSIDYRMIIFDFPGFKVQDDIIPIFKVQYRTIRNIPIKSICFIVERRDRPELIVDSLIGLKETFDDYCDNVIIIVTKTDKMFDIDIHKTKNYIIQKTGFNKIIFSDIYTTGYEILDKINV